MDPIEPIGRTISSSLIGGIILVAVIAAAVAGTILWRGRNGDPFASARSVPAGMDFVVTFDAVALSDSERLQSFVDAFAGPMVEAGVIEDYPEDLVAAIDDAMAAESDFTLSGDVLPWIGRSVSIAGSVPEVDPTTFEPAGLSFLVSADVRNRGAAGSFVDKVVDEMHADDLEVTVATIGGLPGYRWEESVDGISFGMVLTDDSLLVGVEGDVAQAIAARDAGLSIADGAVFSDTMGRLPADRMVSFYMAESALDGFLDVATAAGLSGDEITGAPFDAIGASVSLVAEGVRFNYVVAGGDTTDPGFIPDSAVLASLPDDTLGFISIAGGSSGNSTATDQLLESMGGALEELSSQTGIDIGALLGSLSGRVTFAVTETRNGAIAAQTDVPVGMVGALGINEPGPISDLLAMVEQSLGEPGVEFDRSEGVTTVLADGEQIVSYSTGSDLFVVGTDRDLVNGVVSGDAGGLLGSPLYKELDGLVLGDGLVGYADVGSIVDLVPLTQDEAAVFAPIRGIGYGGEDSEGAFQMEVLILVDY
jgi:hypothetical protein